MVWGFGSKRSWFNRAVCLEGAEATLEDLGQCLEFASRDPQNVKPPHRNLSVSNRVQRLACYPLLTNTCA
jgi:hypothetical protein